MLGDRDYLGHGVWVSFPERLSLVRPKPTYTLSLFTQSTLRHLFAGQDKEATERARSYFTGYPPSSPSIAILREGKLVYVMQRSQIESRVAPAIAEDLKAAFDQHCATTAAR